jgi:SAM-dependent methyltransferase
MKLVKFNNKEYPYFQCEGNAAQFIIPFAKKLCIGGGVDVGCNKLEWCFPGAAPIDPEINDFHALHFPHDNYDYIFSSHCLEHIENWVEVLEYWKTKIKKGGIIFLYLPDYSQEYWRPWNNRKHKVILTSEILRDYFIEQGFINIFYSGVDLNNSFTIVAEKQ